MIPKVNSYRFALKWGVISGAISMVYRIALVVLEKDKVHQVYSQYLSLFFVSIAIVSIVAIYLYKKANNSFLTLKQAIQIGVLVVVVTTVLITIYDGVFLLIIEPDYYQSYYELNWEAELEHYLSLNPEERTVETFKNFVETRKTDHFKIVAPALLIYGVITNLIPSLIAGLILRTKRNKIKN